MNRHLIWIIAGTSMLGLGVPALAAARSDGSPDDNGVPGEVRGNCDEAEHANDPECLAIVVPGTGAVVVTVPSSIVTIPSALPASSDATTIPSITAPSDTVPSNTVPSNTVPSNTAAVRAVPGNTVPGTSVPDDGPDDVSGPCDEVEHAGDPRCTGVGDDDTSGHGGNDDGADHDLDDDNSGTGGSDDSADDDASDDARDIDDDDDDDIDDDDDSDDDDSDDSDDSDDDHSDDAASDD